MAPKNKKKVKAPTPQGSDRKGESEGLLHGLLTVLLSMLIVLVVFGGAFYYVLKNNVYGIGEQFRPSIERIPVIKLALPPLPETEDPYDPKHLTQRELLEKYNELRNVKAEMTDRLEEISEQLAELEKEKEQWFSLKEEAEANKAENLKILEKIEEEKAKLEADRKELSRLIVEGDSNGFKEYFEKVDEESAQKLYQELIEQDAASQKLKSLTKPYEEMDAVNAANILTELGNSDMPLLVDLIGAMKADAAAEIVENMDPEFAAGLMQRLADKKLGKTNK